MKLSDHERWIAVARLGAAGIPLPVEDNPAIKPNLLVECLNKKSRAFDLKRGSEYVLDVKISNNSYGNLRVHKLRGKLLEEDWPLTFQGDSKQFDQERATYRTLSGRYFPYDLVLNHHIGCEIAPGKSVEGKLLALNLFRKIPEDYRHGLSVPLELIITDQYFRQYASTIEVLVDRTATMSKPTVFNRVRRSLYDGVPLEAPKFDHRIAEHPPVHERSAREAQTDGQKR